MADQNDSGNAFLSFLLGAAAGAVVGLLWAPRAGKETRKKIQSWADDMQERGEDLYRTGRQKGEDYIRQGKEKVNEGVEKAKRAADTARSAFNDIQNS